MNSSIHMFQMLGVSAFIYHALYVWRLSRADKLPVPFSGVVPMALCATVYYISAEAMWHTESVLLLRSLRHAIWICGLFFAYFNLIALQSFLELKKLWLNWARRIIEALIALATLSLISLLLVNREFLFSSEPGLVPPQLPPIIGTIQSANAVTAGFSIILMFVTSGCYGYFIWKVNSSRRDFWLSATLALSLAAIFNELLIGCRAYVTGFSFLFVAQLAEMVRLTTLIDRANRKRMVLMEEAMRLTHIGELTSLIMHELRTPLTSLSLAVDSGVRILEKENSEMSRDLLYPILQMAKSSVGKMSTLIEEVGRGSRIETDTLGTFDLGQCIRDSVRMTAQVFSKEGVQLDLDLEDTQIKVVGDVAKFQQVLLNLFQNAKDATEGRTARKIGVSAVSQDRSVEVRVRDNGCGVPAELSDKIFVPFFTTKSPGKGTGIGLTFVANQIEKMGGKIRFESASGGGAEFIIELKLAGNIA